MCAFVTTLFKSCKITSDFVVIFSLVCGCVVFFFFLKNTLGESWYVVYKQNCLKLIASAMLCHKSLLKDVFLNDTSCSTEAFEGLEIVLCFY